MTTIKFYGGNDDLIEVEGPVVDPFDGMSDTGEFCSERSNPGPVDFKETLLIVDAEGSPKVKVYAFFDGCWTFAPSMIDEENPIPPHWKFIIKSSLDCGYSIELLAEVDDGCYVTL